MPGAHEGVGDLEVLDQESVVKRSRRTRPAMVKYLSGHAMDTQTLHEGPRTQWKETTRQLSQHLSKQAPRSAACSDIKVYNTTSTRSLLIKRTYSHLLSNPSSAQSTSRNCRAMTETI